MATLGEVSEIVLNLLDELDVIQLLREHIQPTRQYRVDRLASWVWELGQAIETIEDDEDDDDDDDDDDED
jgi:hypothetical protein